MQGDGFFVKNGVWKFRVARAPGGYRQVSTGIKASSARRAPREAIEMRAEYSRAAREGKLPTDMARWTLRQSAAWWTTRYRPGRGAQSTIEAEKYRMQRFVAALGADRKLSDVTNPLLDEYVSSRLKAGKSAASINKELNPWILLLKKAKLWPRLEHDYKPLRVPVSDIGQALTRDQLRHLATIARGGLAAGAAPARHDGWTVAFYASVLAANVGLRSGEVKKLMIGIAEAALEQRQIQILRKTAKNDGSARFPALNADAIEALRILVARYHAICEAVGLRPHPKHYLLPRDCSRVQFGAAKGVTGYDPTRHQRYWDTAWDSLTKAAGLDGFRFHDLRHTFITHMVERGVPMQQIMVQVGHLSSRMVRHYTHISTAVLHQAVAVLDSEPMLCSPTP